jgi:ribosomal protein L31
MVTTQQLAAARTFLASCVPANALRLRPSTQSHPDWQGQLHTAQSNRRLARTALQDLCGTRDAYQEAIAAARLP